MSAPAAFVLGRDVLVISDPQAVAWVARALRREMDRADIDGVGRPPAAAREVAVVAEALVVRVGLARVPQRVPLSTPAVPSTEGWLTVEDGASRLGRSEGLVRRMCRSGRLEAVRHRTRWLIDPASLEDHMSRQAP